jgi:hypothetical protein
MKGQSMLLIRLSGHSGAGKSRLLAEAAAPRHHLSSRGALHFSPGAMRDQHRRTITSFRVRPLQRSEFDFTLDRSGDAQAVDLKPRVEIDLRSSNTVMVEIFADSWPGLLRRRRADALRHSQHISLPDGVPEGDLSRGPFIQSEVERILRWRNKDAPDKIRIRAASAVDEILTAISPEGSQNYARIFDSAPEGPDGEDEWTRDAEPVGDARRVLEEFIAFYAPIAT